MTSYVEGALIQDEKIVHIGHISKWSLWHLIALGILLLPVVIGLSYILIRALQLLVDMAETPSLRPGPISLFSFLTSWPCLISGPIQRYQDFREQLESMRAFKLGEEELVVESAPLAAIPQLILSGAIRHALVIAAFYLFDHTRSSS